MNAVGHERENGSPTFDSIHQHPTHGSTRRICGGKRWRQHRISHHQMDTGVKCWILMKSLPESAPLFNCVMPGGKSKAHYD